MNIAVLFDGAGLARLGLERAGHNCLGVELDPSKHRLGRHVGSGQTVLADATTFDLTGFDAVWASPPCQVHSVARTSGVPTSKFAGNWRDWSLAIPHVPVLWVENVTSQSPAKNGWGKVWNAAQFLEEPIQSRNRIIGGRYTDPAVFHPYRKRFPGICPCITATEYKGCASDTRRAARFYGRRIEIAEAAYHQGFEIPDEWYDVPAGWTRVNWMRNMYEAIGNGVPVYMAEAFGRAYPS